MNLNSRNIYIIYILLYFSILVGFYFNEDFGLGYLSDYYGGKQFISLFENNFVKTLLNFDKFATSHSPIYYIYVLFLEKISFNESVARLINLHASLLIPYFFYLCLKLKYKFQKEDLRSLIPCIIFFSPYFRSSSIWIGSENISLLFLVISFYFFLKYEFNKENFSYIFFNVLFLACAAYFRPIYAIFSIYFFLRFYLDLKFSNKLLYYILINVLLSLPAIYYVFILDINFFLIHIGDQSIELSRFVSQFSICFSIIFFYSIPFLLININNNLKLSIFKIENIILSIIFIYLLIFHFNYEAPYGGSIFYKVSLLIFDNNYLFYFFSLIAFNVLLAVIFFNKDIKNRISDLILFLTLIFLEPDRFIYHETFDPLLYFIFFLLIKSKIYLNFTLKLTNKKFILLILFSISFYALSILKVIHNPIEMPGVDADQSSNKNLFYNSNIS